MRVFDVQSANKTLPLVRSIVRDILGTGQAIRRLVYVHGQESDSLSEYKDLNEKLQTFIGELEDLGCVYKDYDFSIGLVDFPALIDSKEVFLCWRSDEDHIEFYHGIQEGFSARKNIPEQYFYPDSGEEQSSFGSVNENLQS